MKRIALLYHGIDEPRGAHYTITRRDFVSQMDFLKAAGFTGRSVQDGSQSPAGKDVIITYDDGCASDFDGFRELEKRGFSASFAISTARVGSPGHLGWEQINEMCSAGMEIGSHTHTHRILTTLDDRTLRAELAVSRDMLEQRLGIKVELLSIPGGFYDARVLAAAREAAYSVICTSNWASNGTVEGQNGILHRISIAHNTTLDDFASIVEMRFPAFQLMLTKNNMLRFTKRLLGAQRYTNIRRAILKKIRPSGTFNPL